VNTGPVAPSGASSDRGFFSKLFDFSFSEFVTTSVIRVVYALLVVFAALAALAIFVSLAAQGGGGVVVGLILAPLLFLLYVLIARIYLEVLIVLFRIAESTEETATHLRNQI
jgi:hypothetical protein